MDSDSDSETVILTSETLTKPGYQVFSSSFIVEYIAGYRIWGEDEDEDREDLKDGEDCHMIMMDLIDTFEMWPRNMARVEKEVELLLDVDIRSEIPEMPGINAFTNWVHISNDTISRKLGERIKTVDVHVQHKRDDIKLLYIFEVRKKQEMKTLQTLAAETISECISKREDLEHLKVPKQLLAYLNESCDDVWRVNLKCKLCNVNLEDTYFVQCPSNIFHKFCLNCCRDSTIKQGSGSVEFCPSGRRCQPQDFSVPWTFSWPWTKKWSREGWQVVSGQ